MSAKTFGWRSDQVVTARMTPVERVDVGEWEVGRADEDPVVRAPEVGRISHRHTAMSSAQLRRQVNAALMSIDIHVSTAPR